MYTAAAVALRARTRCDCHAGVAAELELSTGCADAAGAHLLEPSVTHLLSGDVFVHAASAAVLLAAMGVTAAHGGSIATLVLMTVQALVSAAPLAVCARAGRWYLRHRAWILSAAAVMHVASLVCMAAAAASWGHAAMPPSAYISPAALVLLLAHAWDAHTRRHWAHFSCAASGAGGCEGSANGAAEMQ